MPADSVDPRIDEGREQPAVEGDAHGDPGEEGEDELDSGHRSIALLTARTYPVGASGSRRGSDQRAVMPSSVQAAGRGGYSAVWAMPSGPGHAMTRRADLDTGQSLRGGPAGYRATR